MAEQAAAPAPAAEAAPSLNPSAAAAKFVETKEAAAKPPVDKPVEAVAEKPAPAKKPTRIDPNLVKREREATESLQRAQAIENKFKPLSEALAKRDLSRALSLMAEEHGVTFADFVEVLKGAGDSEETLEQKAGRIARETIEAAKAKDAAEAAERAKAADAEKAKDIEARVSKMRERLAAMAEGDPSRWEETAVAGKAGEAWDLIEAHHGETGVSLDLDKALDLVEGKLREKRQALAKKKAASNPAGQTRNEADGRATGGRAAEPSINNRTTSGATGVIPARDPNAPVDFGKRGINDAIARALPHLANA